MTAIDASALLAFLFRERGHERMVPFLEEGCISTVNVAEVLGRFARDGHDPRAVLNRLAATPMEIVPFSHEHAALAAVLLPAAQPLGLSLGDRACLALASARHISAVTADRTWTSLRIGVEIRVIR
jgi:PIN domain nuclease of toxin-antitoxin system